MRVHWGWLAGIAVAVGLVGGVPAQDAPAPPSRCGVVFVANGSGESYALSENLNAALIRARAPLLNELVPWWSSGNPIVDHADHIAQLMAARGLAARAQAFRARFPQARIVFAAHSSGNRVVLAAAELMPPDSIDRIILLAASVDCRYNLCGALRASREGIDSFWSEYDDILEIAVDMLGTADGRRGPAAGRAGFLVPPPGSPDAFLYQKLRQHRWIPGYSWTGYRGTHYGVTVSTFLWNYVLPLMMGQ